MVKIILKFAFAFALLYWLTQSGKIDFSLIQKSYQHGPEWLIAIIIFTIQGCIVSYRYKLLIETRAQKDFSYFNAIKLNWIGMFFSSILPGAVTGDLIKLFYIRKHDSSLSKTFLVTSVFVDRILGLLGLLFVSGLFSSLYYSEIKNLSPQIIHVVHINFLLFVGGSVGLFILIAPKMLQKIINHYLYKIPKIGHQLVNKLEHVFSLSHHRKTVFYSMLLSIANQFLSIFVFWYLTKPFYETALPFQYAFSFIPIGMIAIAIPISPAGLGVGHAIFQNLFNLVGMNNGASLFNLFFVYNVLVNLFGFVPYLLAGARPSNKDLEEELKEV